MENLSQKVAQGLLKRGAVKFSLDPPFTWSSGIKSPIYCDNRMMTSFPQDRDLIVEGYVQMIRDNAYEPEAIGGTATGGISWAAMVAQKMNLPMFYVRPKPKAHGTGKQIEGFLEKGSKVIMIEDLFASGGSALAGVRPCRAEADSDILAVLSIATYEFPILAKNFEEEDLRFHTLVGFSQILEELVRDGKFSDEEFQTILKFREDPEGWLN